MSKSTKNKPVKNEPPEGYKYLIFALGEASKISISLVMFPIVFLFAGLWLDKKLSTVPLFIILGIIAGVISAIYQLVKLKKDILKIHKK